MISLANVVRNQSHILPNIHHFRSQTWNGMLIFLCNAHCFSRTKSLQSSFAIGRMLTLCADPIAGLRNLDVEKVLNSYDILLHEIIVYLLGSELSQVRTMVILVKYHGFGNWDSSAF